MAVSQRDDFLKLTMSPDCLLSLFEELEKKLEERSEALLNLRNALLEFKVYLRQSVSKNLYYFNSCTAIAGSVIVLLLVFCPECFCYNHMTSQSLQICF